MICPYLGSGNPSYAGFYECDLVKGATLCSGEVQNCEHPETRLKQEERFKPAMEDESLDEPEGDDGCPHGVGFDEDCEWCDDEDELIQEANAHMEWLEIQDYTKHVGG